MGAEEAVTLREPLVMAKVVVLSPGAAEAGPARPRRAARARPVLAATAASLVVRGFFMSCPVLVGDPELPPPSATSFVGDTMNWAV